MRVYILNKLTHYLTNMYTDTDFFLTAGTNDCELFWYDGAQFLAVRSYIEGFIELPEIKEYKDTFTLKRISTQGEKVFTEVLSIRYDKKELPIEEYKRLYGDKLLEHLGLGWLKMNNNIIGSK
jgi:hypothetical protein